MRLSIAASALTIALLAWPVSVRAATAGVHDEAGFFSADAVTKADEVIKNVQRESQKELVIETFRGAPAGKQEEAASADPKVKDRFFADWAVQQAQDERVNGIYVLICKEPPYIKPAVGNQTRREFSDADRDRLGQILVDRFKKKEYDDGLLEAVRFVQSALKGAGGEATGRTAGQQGPVTWPPYQPTGGDRGGPSGLGGWLCVGLVVVAVVGAGLWALSSLFRSFQHGPMSYGPGNPGFGPGAYGYGPGGFMGGYGGGGGGFLPSVLGGLFGGVAGGWAYDRFGRPSAPMQGPAPAPPPSFTPEPPQVDTSFSAGGGGDFGGGGSGGGGDAGGGGAF